jgi:hypothetical protein
MEDDLRKKLEIPEDFPYKPNENKLYERSLTTCSPMIRNPGRSGNIDASSVTCVFKRLYTQYHAKHNNSDNPKNYILYKSIAFAEIMVPGYDAPASSMVYELEDKATDQMPLLAESFPTLCKWWEENQGTVVNEQTGQIIAKNQVWITIEEQLKRLYPKAKEKKDDNSSGTSKTNSSSTRAATA